MQAPAETGDVFPDVGEVKMDALVDFQIWLTINSSFLLLTWITSHGCETGVGSNVANRSR